MINQLEGVLGRDALPKQGGDKEDKYETKKEESQPKQATNEYHKQKPKIDHKGNEASGLKGKENVFNDDEEDAKLSEGEKLFRKKHDQDLDSLLRLQKDLEEKEDEVKAAKVTLKPHKSLFTHWTMERIQRGAVYDPSVHWLEPSISFDLNNTMDSQFDFPITPRAFMFRCFGMIERAPLNDHDVNHKLFSFCLKYGTPQFQT